MTSWFQQGYNGPEEEARQEAKYGGPPRFWLKKDAKSKILFVDDEPIIVEEHAPTIDGRFDQTFTCGAQVHEDPLCCEKFGRDSRYRIGYYTIIEVSPTTDSNGKEHSFGIKLFPAKMGTLKILQSKKEDRENRLAGRIYNVARIDAKAPRVGDQFEFDREADMEKAFLSVNYKGKKLSELWKLLRDPEKTAEADRLTKLFSVAKADGKPVDKIVPFNYLEILRPKTNRELREMLKGARIETGRFGNKAKSGPTSDQGAARQGDDDVPF